MADRSVALIVQHTTVCPLLKLGDRWPLTGNELHSIGGGKMCAAALCSVFPKLRDILAGLPPGAPLPDEVLICDVKECDAAFRMEFITAVPKPKIVPMAAQPSMTRRLERGSSQTTTTLKKQGPFLSRLSKELASELVAACSTKRYEDGQIVLMQGVVGDHLYIVGDGTVEVARWSKDQETILVALGAGECFGEMSILTGDVTTAEVRARGPAVILSVNKEKLEALLLRMPALSREFSKLLAARLKATNVSLESELNRGVLGKLSMISLVDLVQTLHQGRRTGTLVLNYTGKQAKLGFRNGNMVTGLMGDVKSEEVFYQVVCWPDGDFCFEQQTEPEDNGPGKIGTDLMGLMMEGMRRMDEAKAAAAAAAAPGETAAVEKKPE
jgi:CRP-like cAMP-binding protein